MVNHYADFFIQCCNFLNEFHSSIILKMLYPLADLSTNICEDVIYIDKAKVVKHHLEEE